MLDTGEKKLRKPILCEGTSKYKQTKDDAESVRRPENRKDNLCSRNISHWNEKISLIVLSVRLVSRSGCHIRPLTGRERCTNSSIRPSGENSVAISVDGRLAILQL